MKLCLTDKNSLYSAFQLVQGIVEKKSINPILSSILVETKKPDSFEIKCTNLEESLYIRIWAEVENDFKFAVSAKRLVDFIRELPDSPVIFDVDENVLKISCENIEATLPLIETEDYPDLPKVPENTLILDRDTFLDAVEKVYFSIATDSISASLMGMFVKKEGKFLSFVSTDGHRLSVVEKQLKDEEFEFEVIVPRKGVQELKKILEKKIEEDIVEIGISENHFFLKAGNVQLFTRIIDAKFPNYEKIIPVDFDREFTVSVADLNRATKRISLFSSDKMKAVKIDFNPEESEIVISSVKSSDDTFSGVASQKLAVEDCEGEEMSFGLNAKYLMEALGAFDSQKVKFRFGEKLWPIKLESSEDVGYLHIIMPLNLEE